MKYFEVAFTLTPYSSDACDVLAALAGETGFETFMETEKGLTGYVQQALFDESALKEELEDFPFEGTGGRRQRLERAMGAGRIRADSC